VQRKQAPSSGPQEQIRLPLYAVNISEETRHERRGDKQRKRDESMIRQSSIYSRVRQADNSKSR
jgi:hypothetical protein